MLGKNFACDDNSQYFSTPIKHNHVSTAQSFRVPLILDLLQCQHNITPKMTCQKLPPYGMEYIYFQTVGITARASQCTRPRLLPKYVDSILSIGSFEKKSSLN